jgi:hypothetical protein
MFFSKTQRTLPSKPGNKDQVAKPRKWLFMPLKHASLVPTNHITIIKHIWIKRTNKQHQNHAWDTKSKNYQLKTVYMFIQYGFKIGFLNSFWSWTNLANQG